MPGRFDFMSLKNKVTEDMKAAMRAKETARLSTIRLLLAAMKQKEVDERMVLSGTELTDADVLSIIEKMLKQRRESIAQYEKAARADLADVEKAEIAVLSAYLPQQMSESEVAEAVLAAIKESGAAGAERHGQSHGLAEIAARRPHRHGQALGSGKSKASWLNWRRRPRRADGALRAVIPESFKQDLLNRVDVVEVVSRYVRLKKAGANFQGLCPFHNEKTPSFSVSPAKQFYHCFGCGAHGNAIGFLMSYGGMGYVDAVKDLASQAGMQVPEMQPRSAEQVQRETERKEQETGLVAVMERAMEFYRAELKKAAARHRIPEGARTHG